MYVIKQPGTTCMRWIQDDIILHWTLFNKSKEDSLVEEFEALRTNEMFEGDAFNVG